MYPGRVGGYAYIGQDFTVQVLPRRLVALHLATVTAVSIHKKPSRASSPRWHTVLRRKRATARRALLAPQVLATGALQRHILLLQRHHWSTPTAFGDAEYSVRMAGTYNVGANMGASNRGTSVTPWTCRKCNLFHVAAHTKCYPCNMMREQATKWKPAPWASGSAQLRKGRSKSRGPRVSVSADVSHTQQAPKQVTQPVSQGLIKVDDAADSPELARMKDELNVADIKFEALKPYDTPHAEATKAALKVRIEQLRRNTTACKPVAQRSDMFEKALTARQKRVEAAGAERAKAERLWEEATANADRADDALVRARQARDHMRGLRDEAASEKQRTRPDRRQKRVLLMLMLLRAIAFL